MNKYVYILLILMLCSCSSTEKERKLLEKENELLKKELELTKKEQEVKSKKVEKIVTKKEPNPPPKKKSESAKKGTGYTFDNFHVSENRVGIFSKGMTVSDVYNSIPKEQIKKKVGYGEFADDTFDDYEIYDSDGRKILILTPKQSGSTNSEIRRISILDKRFKTTEKIGLNSTFGDLSKYYSTSKISPDREHIIVDIEHISAWFSIEKTELMEGWWNGSGIDKTKIPNSAKFDGVTIWWR